jgi:hypothetical protein
MASEAPQWISAVTPLSWPILALAAFLYFRKDIRRVIKLLLERIQEGSGIKVGPVELAALNVITHALDSGLDITKGFISVESDGGYGDRKKKEIFDEMHSWFLAHTLYRSEIEDQRFDVMIYVVGHENDLMLEIMEVRYFLGKYWGDKKIVSRDRMNAFAVVISTRKPTLCYAEIVLRDETVIPTWRFLDFEMAHLATSAAKAGDRPQWNQKNRAGTTGRG